MSKRTLIPLLIVTVAAGAWVAARSVGWEHAVLATAWALVVTALLSLALYRLLLSHYDHVLRAAGANNAHPLRRWFHHREDQIDHAGILLTIGGALYTLAIVVLLLVELVQKTITTIMTPFSVR